MTDEAVERLLGRGVATSRSGGAVRMLTLDDGTEVVAKVGDVAAEAAGLRWLAEPAAVAVPAVLAAEDDLLVTERVPPGEASPASAERFGRDLAALHAAGAPAFGAPPPGGPVEAWIGGARMRNVTGRSWPEWYAEHRVLPYARQARDRGALDGDGLATIERTCTRIDRLAGSAEPPARLHGDLWSGNVLWSGGRDTKRSVAGPDGRDTKRSGEHADRGARSTAWVIDPAAHGGHRETDLAMLALFGCPHLERVLASYDEASPLAEGWRDRVGLHQLFPLLVHAVLFGGGYGPQAVHKATG